MDNLINGVGVGDPVVNIGHNINTDVTKEILGLDVLGEGSLAEASDGEDSEELEHGAVTEVCDLNLSF